MAPDPRFVAQVAAPPPPLIVPLAHTEFVAPTFPTLLMHEDLDGAPPLASPLSKRTPKAKAAKQGVTFAKPPSLPPSPSNSVCEGLTLSKFMVQIPTPECGASRIKNTDFAEMTGWTQAFCNEFSNFVEDQCAQILDPTCAWTVQEPSAKQAIIDKTIEKYPCVKDYEGYWPMEKVTQRFCKNSTAKLARAQEQIVLTDVKKLRPRKGRGKP
ncbi:hypothetical protein R3P38DRAFT_2985317 [Favolaschia claudopus]|uniref:Uncharacterized protein n=1 Tax=Favolaschia claudopus TaxID=2862362 RepID=A0AAW0AX24_9AGAR